MRISTIVPTHDRPSLIVSAMDSVMGQTRHPDEMLVVDDFGDKATESIVNNFAASAPFPIKYVINRQIVGACGSRNLGASLASSELVAFLDDDDVWRPRHLELAERAIADNGVDFAVTGLVRYQKDRPDEVRFACEGLTPATLFSETGGMTGSNLVISRDSFRRVGGFDPAIPVFDDWDLFMRLLKDRQIYSVVREPLVEWRYHEGDRLSSAPSLRRADGIDAFVARYGPEMPASLHRKLRTTSLGIRRRHAGASWRGVKLSIYLAFAHTPYGALKRLAKRFGRVGSA